MNVLICVNTLDYGMGGVSTHILDICKQYSKLEEVNKLIVCCDGGEHVPKLKSISGVKYVEVPFNSNGMNLRGIISSYKAVWKAIGKEHIDIMHIHSQRILPVAHIIYMLHGIPYLWTNHIDAIPQPRLFKFMCRIMRFPIISVSGQLSDMMITEYGCKPNRCYIVNNGIDMDEYTPLSADEIKQLEENYNIDRSKTPYVISLLSRMAPVKGHMRLLEAINKLEEKNSIKVIFAGHTYPYAEGYKQQLVKYCEDNNIDSEFLDYSKPRDVFGVSDLFVLPSLYEGFSLVCVEALAMKCAVIRSRTPGWHEMQKWVEIVEKNDVDGLRDKIFDAICNGFNKKKTDAGYEAVRIMFTKERCARSTVDVYHKIINK